MTNFGTPNPTVEKTRAIRHLCAKKFIPVFERVVIEEKWLTPRVGDLRYIRHSYNYFSPTPTSKPKTLWAIARARRAKVGQLKLL